MAASGVKCSNALKLKYEEFKKSGLAEKVDFIVAEIRDGSIEIQEAPDAGTTATETGKNHVNGVPTSYLAMEKLCKEGQCRYAFYIFKWQEGARKMSNVVMICFSDDNADSKLKMLYSSSKEAVKQTCKGATIIQANDDDEINYFTVLGDISKNRAPIDKTLND